VFKPEFPAFCLTYVQNFSRDYLYLPPNGPKSLRLWSSISLRPWGGTSSKGHLSHKWGLSKFSSKRLPSKSVSSTTSAMEDISSLPAQKPSLWKRLKSVVFNAKDTFKQSGFKGVVKRYGWKVFAVFFVYYLVRDVTLYILIPWLIAKHFVG
jgi:hypothetical protein